MKKITLVIFALMLLPVMAIAQTTKYVITGSGTTFSAYKGNALLDGAVGVEISDVVGAIRTDANANDVEIKFGDSTDVLDLGSTGISFQRSCGMGGCSIHFGKITLSGKVTSSSPYSTVQVNNTESSLTVNAEIQNTNPATDGSAYALSYISTKTLTITGGKYESKNGYAVNASGQEVTKGEGVIISGGEFSAASAALNVVNFDSLVISGGTFTSTGYSTVYSGSEKVAISGGVFVSVTGNALSASTKKLTITGGNFSTLSAAATIYSSVRLELGGSPIIAGYIAIPDLIVITSGANIFAPGTKKYFLSGFTHEADKAVVIDGKGFLSNFEPLNDDWALKEASTGNNLVLVKNIDGYILATTDEAAAKYRITKLKSPSSTEKIQDLIAKIGTLAKSKDSCFIEFGSGADTLNLGTQTLKFNTTEIPATACANIVLLGKFGMSFYPATDQELGTSGYNGNYMILIENGSVISRADIIKKGKRPVPDPNVPIDNQPPLPGPVILLSGSGNNGKKLLTIESGIISGTGAGGILVENGILEIKGKAVLEGYTHSVTGQNQSEYAISARYAGGAPTGVILDGSPTIKGNISVPNNAVLSLGAGFSPDTLFYISVPQSYVEEMMLGLPSQLPKEVPMVAGGAKFVDYFVLRGASGYGFTAGKKGSVNENVLVIASYNSIVKVIDGIGGGSYNAGEIVTVTANDAPTGYVFSEWKVTYPPQTCNPSDPGCFIILLINSDKPTAQFVMPTFSPLPGQTTPPEIQVNVRAIFEEEEITPIRLPQIAGGQTSVKAIGNAIVMENVPTNAKVQIYNIKGTLVGAYGIRPTANAALTIPMQTKGVYIVKINQASYRVVVR